MTPPLQHLDLPFARNVSAPITQPFAFNNPGLEPECWSYGNGEFGFHWDSGAVEGSWHLGIDYGLACGTPLLAPAAGTVSSAGWDTTGFGNLTILDHGGGLLTFHAHQSHITVQPGEVVAARQQIGLSGTTGNSTGCHLHWACATPDGRGYYYFFDPAPYLAYQPTDSQPTGTPPTAWHYKLLADMMLRTQPAKDAPTGGAVLKNTIVVADQGWTTNWRRVKVPDGRVGWLFAPNLAKA